METPPSVPVVSAQPAPVATTVAAPAKPSHRIEFVKSINGVNYYDDSKGTNIDAVIRAVEGINGKIVLIAGGVDKGFPYTSWIDAFGGKVKAICAIGQSKEKSARCANQQGNSNQEARTIFIIK